MRTCDLAVEAARVDDVMEQRFPGLREVRLMRRLKTALIWDDSFAGQFTAAVGDEYYERFLAPDGAVWGNGYDDAKSIHECVKVMPSAYLAMEQIWRFVTMPERQFVAIYKLVAEGAEVVMLEIFRLAVDPAKKTAGPVVFHSKDCSTELLDWSKSFAVFDHARVVSK